MPLPTRDPRRDDPPLSLLARVAPPSDGQESNDDEDGRIEEIGHFSLPCA
jgi:hypothetical protein